MCSTPHAVSVRLALALLQEQHVILDELEVGRFVELATEEVAREVALEHACESLTARKAVSV